MQNLKDQSLHYAKKYSKKSSNHLTVYALYIGTYKKIIINLSSIKINSKSADMKHLNLTLAALFFSIISFAQAPASISGTANMCIGTTTVYTDATSGGSWTSANPGVVTVDPSLGVATPAGLGSTDILYTTTGGTVLISVTVNPVPDPITAPSTICPGATTTLTETSTDGTWSATSITGSVSIDPVSGDITGVSPGSVAIYYTSSFGCSVTTSIDVNFAPFPYSMSGDGTACSGAPGVDVQLVSGSTPGVSYQLYQDATAVGAPIDGTGSLLDFGFYGTAGTYTITGTNLTTGCIATMTGNAVITAALSPAPYLVSGGGAICSGAAGVPIGLASTDAGITYQLYSGTTAIGAPISGTGTGISFGTTTTAGTYTVAAVDPATSCSSNMSGTAIVVVNPLPALFTIAGGGGYCSGTAGMNITLSGSASGVNYQLLTGVTPVGTSMSGTGAALSFGFHTGTTTGTTYTVLATNSTTGCTRTMTGTAVVTADSLIPSVSIISSPGGTVCAGTSVSLGAVPVNGGPTPVYAWSVNHSSATTTGNTYTYVPTNNDTVHIKLTSSLPCASPHTADSSVIMSVHTPAISASSSSLCGGSDVLTVTGALTYVWTPASGLSCSTCDTAIVAPSSTLVYTITGTDNFGCVAKTTVTADGNSISGHISVTGAPGTIKVWLIKFNPADSSLTALDSVLACSDNGTPYYSFKDKPTGNYLLKAMQLGGTPGSNGYVATYGSSSLHWDNATGLLHGTGTDTMHIDLLYGIVPPGTGFISGYVFTGANKSTTTSVAPGMLVFLTDATSGNVITYKYTDDNGAYYFGGLGWGSYIVYPELYHFYTTPAYVITLNSANDSVSAINFKQHTNYGVITPYIIAAHVNPVSAANGINIYPNPTNGLLNIVWTNQQTGSANVTVTDVVGREVYSSTVEMNATAGQQQIDLGKLKNGMYMINIKSAGNTYSGKLVVQQ